MTTPPAYLTAKEAAAKLGLSYPRIRQLLRQGRIEGAVKPQRDWLIPEPIKVLPPGRKQY